MILPITGYGSTVLRKETRKIEKGNEKLPQIIDNMFETMYKADGVGLAGPQVGLSLRIFVVDAAPFAEDDPALGDFKKVFINPTITERSGKNVIYEEGCLSIPFINEDVSRKSNVKIEYYDENFEHHVDEYDGIRARIVQHEYDHLAGVLFTDLVSPLRKRLIKNKLAAITKGKIKTKYKMSLANKSSKSF